MLACPCVVCVERVALSRFDEVWMAGRGGGGAARHELEHFGRRLAHRGRHTLNFFAADSKGV